MAIAKKSAVSAGHVRARGAAKRGGRSLYKIERVCERERRSSLFLCEIFYGCGGGACRLMMIIFVDYGGRREEMIRSLRMCIF